MSSTNDGNPPIAIKVKKAATNMSIDPLACKFHNILCYNTHDIFYLNDKLITYICKRSNHLNGTIRVANIIEYSSHAQTKCNVDCKAKPIISQVTVHVHERSSCKNKRLSYEPSIFPFRFCRTSALQRFTVSIIL